MFRHQLVTDTQTLLQALADNVAIYASPSPTLPVVTASLNKFINAIAASADGGAALTAAKNAARAELVALLRLLATYVHVACKGNLENLLLSGFPTQKPNRVPIGVLPPPSNVTVNLGARTGELDSKANPVDRRGHLQLAFDRQQPGRTRANRADHGGQHDVLGPDAGDGLLRGGERRRFRRPQRLERCHQPDGGVSW